MKKLLFTMLMAILISGTVYAADVNVQLNGSTIDFTDSVGNKVDAQIVNNRTMVPMRRIFELLGATVNWEERNSNSNCK